MELILNRDTYDSVSTEGCLSIAGAFQCATLELPFSSGMPGSAILEGRFKVVLGPSPKFMSSKDPWVQKFAKAMPHLVGVLNRSFIMIHWGNDAANTDGCILVGQTKGLDFIGSSRAAFERLYELLQAAIARNEDVYITVQRAATVN